MPVIILIRFKTRAFVQYSYLFPCFIFRWQKISAPESIAEVLKQVYADHTTKVDKVFSSILEITEHPAAAASLTSIMFAPRGQLSFKEALNG